MNKHIYRIIFNAARGCLMAVAEIACSRKKGPGADQGPSITNLGSKDQSKSLVLHDLVFTCKLTCQAVFLSASFLTFLSAPLYLHAQSTPTKIVSDPSAPNNQQPTVLNASNGVVQVNIQTPSASGISRNAYTQFDVGGQGAILNNSRTNIPSQLGGWIQANPWLATGSAKVILNEVKSNDPANYVATLKSPVKKLRLSSPIHLALQSMVQGLLTQVVSR